MARVDARRIPQDVLLARQHRLFVQGPIDVVPLLLCHRAVPCPRRR
jgi:hypothetical protein